MYLEEVALSCDINFHPSNGVKQPVSRPHFLGSNYLQLNV